MSFFTENELGVLGIRRMILHVVGGKEVFQPQSELRKIDHAEFFLARIQDTANDSVHRFNDGSITKAKLEQMARGDVSFEQGARDLSKDFSSRHVGSSRDGAFFVFELESGDDSVILYSMIKYDYRQAIELYEDGGQNALRQIVQAFVKERKAIQKSCMVRIVNGKAETDVSAQDRMEQAPDLTDYFQNFLDVKRERSNEELSKALNEAVRASMQDCKDLLPRKDVAAAVAAVKEALRGRESINDDAVREAIFVAAGRPEDENVRSALEKSIDRQLKAKRLAGITFKPDSAALRRAPRRKLSTIEGVVIEFPGEQENRSINWKDNGNGGAVITVTTARLVENGTIADRNRRDA